MGNGVASGREIGVGSVLIFIGTSLIAPARRLVVIRPRLIPIARRLVSIRQRLILITQRAVAIARRPLAQPTSRAEEFDAAARTARNRCGPTAGWTIHNLRHRVTPRPIAGCRL